MSVSPTSSESAIASSESRPAGDRSPRWWLWLLIGVLGLGAGWLGWTLTRREGAPPPAAAAATAVETETLQPSRVRVTTDFVGSLEAENRVMLRPEVEGRVTQILVADGESVSAGQPVVQLDSERSQALVSGALANIEAVRASRNTAQADLLEAEANRDSALADQTLQQTEYERTQTLVASGALPQQSLDQVSRSRDAAAASLTAAERRIEAATANLAEANASLTRAESDVAVANTDLSDFRVVAPIDGIVGDMEIKVGDYVNAGTPLTTLTQNQTLDLRLSIPVERGDELQLGMPVELRVDADTPPLLIGSISFISERIEAGAQSILAKATFPNPNGLLRDEQFVRATMIWNEAPGVTVPTTAVSRVGGQSFIFVLAPSEEAPGEYVAVQRPIQLGGIEGNRYQVMEGLEAGETIITAGILRLSDGAPVEPE